MRSLLLIRYSFDTVGLLPIACYTPSLSFSLKITRIKAIIPNRLSSLEILSDRHLTYFNMQYQILYIYFILWFSM